LGPDTDPDEGWRSEIGERRSEKGRRGHGTTDHGLRFFLRFHPCSSGFICGLISSGLSFNAEGAEVRRDSQRVLLLCVSLRLGVKNGAFPRLRFGLANRVPPLPGPLLPRREERGKRGGLVRVAGGGPVPNPRARDDSSPSLPFRMEGCAQGTDATRSGLGNSLWGVSPRVVLGAQPWAG